MASTNIKSVSIGSVLIQSGNGIPNHISTKGSLYIDMNTATEYINKDGVALWELNGVGGFVLTQAQYDAITGATSPSSTNVFVTMSDLSATSFTGGTVNGVTNFLNGLSATTISATTYFNLPKDIYVTGATYSAGTAVFTNNTGGTFSISGFYTGYTAPIDVRVTGGTYSSGTGIASYTNNTGGTFSVSGFFKPSDDIFTTGLTFNNSTYDLKITRNDGTIFSQNLAILATDMTITGGTYNANTGVATFVNNTGGTFNVTGFLTGMTDTYTTGFTYSNNLFTLKRNASQPDLSVLVNTMTGLTISGTLSATTYLGLPSLTGSYLPLSGGTVTGGTNFNNGLTANTFSASSVNIGDYIKFSTGSTTPSTQAGIMFYDPATVSLSFDSFIDPNVRVKIGRQLFSRMNNNSGSIIPKGSAVMFQSASNGIPNGTLAISSGHTRNQVVGLAAADINNGEVGLIITQGILSGITLNTFNVGDILYLSDTVAGGYVSSTSSLQFSSRSHQIGYVIATGSTTGEIYVSINNEDTNLTLTDIERNILEGNVISTGTYEYTGATTASSTTINVAPMRGWIVKNTYQYATLPEVTNLYYTGGTNILITNIGIADSTYLLVNSGATLYQQTTFPTPQQRRENIYLGKVNHPNRSSILNVNNTVDYDVSVMSSLRDLWSPIKYINQGIIPSPNGANLSFNTSAGTLWGNGINWHNNQLSPNNVSISGKTPASFFYRTQTGGTSSSVTVIDPTKYDVGGVITSISPAGSNDATNQRIYLYPTGVINVLYGQTRYATLSEAVAAIQSETFIPYPNAETTGILIGVISVRNDIVADGQPLTNPDYAKFTLVSKFGESFGGTGGLSTTTLQQAYDNSTNPEIVTNSTLNGVQFRGGTGNNLDANIIIEDNTGNKTGQWLGNGLLSATTIQTNNLSATTISATTYLGLPIDVRVTGGTYSAGTAVFTNNTGGTFSISGFSTSNATAFTGGTVTGSTVFTAGLTANTVSATTYYNLPTDIRVTGGTYSAGTAVFTNNTGGTFSISGFSTGTTSTDTYVTGFTYSSNVFTIKQNGQSDLTVLANTMTGLTINGNITVTGTSVLNGGITSTSYTGTTSRMVESSSGGTVTATRAIVSGYISDSTVITNLTTAVNWTINGSYTGTSITGTYQGQNYYDDNYFYTFVADNTPIRLIRG